jgi:hypothetical protein
MKAIAVLLFLTLVLVLAQGAAFAAGDTMAAIRGTIDRIDPVAGTIVVWVDDGSVQLLHVPDQTVICCADQSLQLPLAGKQYWRGLADGADIVAHYAQSQTGNTAIEIDRLDCGDLKAAEGNVKRIDRNAKKLVIAGSDGLEQTFRMTDRANTDAGRHVARRSSKGPKIKVYYTEDGGEKVAHFFKEI